MSVCLNHSPLSTHTHTHTHTHLHSFPQDTYKLAKHLVGKICYVEWPYLVEAKVVAISDGKTKYYHDGGHKSRARIVEHVLTEGEVKQWKEEEMIISRQ